MRPGRVATRADQRRWRALTAVLASFWALEIFLVQEYTLRPPYPVDPRMWAGARLLRLGLDLLLCGVLALTLRRVGLHVVFAVGALCTAGLLVYFDYFDRALSIHTVLGQAGEGIAVAGFAVDLLRGVDAALLLVALGIKVSLVEARHRLAGAVPPRRWQPAVALALAYSALVGFANGFADPLSKFAGQGTLGRMGITYGYLWSWAGEAWYLGGDELVERALRAAREQASDRLTPVETSLSLDGHLVVIQVESLECAVLDHRVGGELVMPRLRSLWERSLRYHVRAVHVNGSGDADFVALTGNMPSPDVISYKLPSYPWRDTLPQRLGRRGYHTAALHGASGRFFDRRPAFEAMGFDQIEFLEDLRGDHGLPAGEWGVKDADLLAFSARSLAQHDRALHFIITLTSHGPFTYLEPSEEELYPGASRRDQHYLNSMRYVDRTLGGYVDSLRPGTTLAVYGDHAAAVDYGQEREGPECVPFLIHRVGADLSVRQKTLEGGLALSGELTLLDAITWLRHQL